MAKKRVPSKAIGNKQAKVPDKATRLSSGSTDNMKPVFSFKFSDSSRWKLSDWNKKEIDDLFKCFKTIESLTWNQLRKHPGLQYKAINNPPDIAKLNVSEDVTICEIRVCKVKRIHGFRSDNVFCVLWFDREHEVCPEGKNRLYG
ncbi:MAG6450 family protein [Clostridium botulinum]|uniref:MAG6450 family protein n=1 Tax=Clostridium botulinum TaxID=1491 RepID=UPI0004729FEA|nr:hypothetical protein [Clostridium botulinum]APU60257.1 hypothetical protein NPD8_2216 [Clostridium botulinum]AUN18190.1 hypothetical protein B2M06_11510 [Clostridium botulinum]KEI90702.1 hypothetical protein N493_14905 [Clostridium botulinum B2 433]KOR54872.1 hypothetical protein ADT23_00325 [Clostridium botulinum]MBD5587622.1 hypothetical protein [Clostridium botulinum]